MFGPISTPSCGRDRWMSGSIISWSSAVGQHPNIFIDGRRVVGLDPHDPIHFINDPRPEYRVPYLERPRTSPTNLQMASGKSAEYVFQDAALRLTEKAVAFIEQHHDAPFFLYLAHRNIHAPLRPNARFVGTSEIGVYGDFIHELDWSVGEVLGALDRLKLTDHTLVFFSSDNGGVKAYQRIDYRRLRGIDQRPVARAEDRGLRRWTSRAVHRALAGPGSSGSESRQPTASRCCGDLRGSPGPSSRTRRRRTAMLRARPVGPRRRGGRPPEPGTVQRKRPHPRGRPWCSSPARVAALLPARPSPPPALNPAAAPQDEEGLERASAASPGPAPNRADPTRLGLSTTSTTIWVRRRTSTWRSRTSSRGSPHYSRRSGTTAAAGHSAGVPDHASVPSSRKAVYPRPSVFF